MSPGDDNSGFNGSDLKQFLLNLPPRKLNSNICQIALQYARGPKVNKAVLWIAFVVLLFGQPWLGMADMVIGFINPQEKAGWLTDYDLTNTLAEGEKVYRVRAAFQGLTGQVIVSNYYSGWKDIPGHPFTKEPPNYGSLSGPVAIRPITDNSSWALLPGGRLHSSMGGLRANTAIAFVLFFFQFPAFWYGRSLRRLLKNGIIGWAAVAGVKESKRIRWGDKLLFDVTVSYFDGANYYLGTKPVEGCEACHHYSRLKAEQQKVPILYQPGHPGQVLIFDDLLFTR